MKRPWLLPLIPLYAAGSALRWIGVQPKRLAWPVVSVGNLSTGGAGKTPFIIALVKLLTRESLHVDVLSRGYGRRSTEVLRVDFDGDAEQFGDEPLLIARRTGVPVYVGSQRWQAGRLAEQEAGAGTGVHILDDGFQHRQLHRNIDIVLVNSEDLDDSLLPAGNLRENLSALRRASILAVPAEDEAARIRIQSLGLSQPVWRFQRKTEIFPIDCPAVAFCGIARPEQFFASLELAGIVLAAHHAFRDHQTFGAREIELLRSLLVQTGTQALITTEKDWIRLGSLEAQLLEVAALHIACLEIEIEQGEEIASWLMQRLQK